MPDGVVGNRYELRERLGSGGHGAVWRAYDRHLRREVALKVFGRGQPVSRAFLDAQLLTALEGQFILRVLNADVYQDVPYMATEVAGEGTAQDRMLPHGVAWNRAVRWVTDLLLGLDVCHSRGLIHRDVKPGNLFLRGEEHAQLGDFGVAEFLDASGQVPAAGDPRVRAPEMFIHDRGDVRSDIYSVGVTLYTLIAGLYPFPTGSPVDAVIRGLVPKLRDVAPHVPQRLASRIARAMALDPEDRYESARDMANALAEVPGSLRVWTRVRAHEGHESCWVSSGGRAQPALGVCVVDVGGRYSIETRRTGGGRTRVRAGCRSKLHRNRLSVELRRVFDTL